VLLALYVNAVEAIRFRLRFRAKAKQVACFCARRWFSRAPSFLHWSREVAVSGQNFSESKKIGERLWESFLIFEKYIIIFKFVSGLTTSFGYVSGEFQWLLGELKLFWTEYKIVKNIKSYRNSCIQWETWWTSLRVEVTKVFRYYGFHPHIDMVGGFEHHLAHHSKIPTINPKYKPLQNILLDFYFLVYS